MEVGLHERQRHVRVEVMRRHDVEHREAGHAIGVIERHAMADAAAAIMADECELLEPELAHDLDLIERHRALGVVGVILAVRRLAAVAVATQVGDDDGVVLGEIGRHQPPRDHRLRRAMQQQHRRALPGHRAVDGDAVDLKARAA